MQKTKLGISVGGLGALLYFSGLFGGYLLTTLLAGYVLLIEENLWLKKAAIKAVALMIGFSALCSLVGLLPRAIDIFSLVVNLFGGHFSVVIIDKIQSLLLAVISFAETILFIVLGLKSFSQGTIRIPLIDDFANKYIN